LPDKIISLYLKSGQNLFLPEV